MYSRKLDRMYHPPSNLDRYDNEEYMKNPLLKFRLADVYERRHHIFLKYRAAEVKMKLSRKRLPSESDIRYLPESHYVDNLRRCVRKIVVPKMLTKTEKQILSYAPKILKQKLPDLVKSYMKDVHDEFDRLMKIYSMKSILVKPELPGEDPAEFDLPKADFRFSLPGKTENYSKFVQNRKRIKQRLLILHIPVRCVLNSSELEFPELLIVFDPLQLKMTQAASVQMGLGERECISHKTLLKYCRTSLDNNNTYLRWTWYPKFICSIRRMYKKRVISSKLWPPTFLCIEGLINRQLNNLKQRTLTELLKVCANDRKIPMLRLNLVCYDEDNSIDISPSIEEILEVYETIAREIADVGNRMEPIQPQIDASTVSQAAEYLRINLNLNYLNEYIEQLKAVIVKTYQPIQQYLVKYQRKYYNLYSQTVMDDLNEFLSEPRAFEEYFTKIDTYFEYINLLRSEPRQDFFVLAIINNEPAIKRLRQIADGLISRITTAITKQHIKTELDICDEFQYIKDRALEIPKTTEELLAAAEYMIFVKKEKLFELRNRIQYCLKIGTNLVELCEMSPYHFDLTITTISWLYDINEICDYNASQQENYKCLFEEHLQEVVKKLNEDIEELIPKITIINDMSDPKKFKEYYIMLQNFIDQLKIFDDYVAWINKEEKLFKIPQTLYPTLDVLKTFVYPFATLMKLCINWMRYHSVWLDGPFEYLEPKFVELTTDNYLKEFQKNQKYYRQKIKQDLIDNPICKFKGQTEDPDPENHPVPLRLCNKMIQSIKDFTIGVFIVNNMCNPALRKRHWKEMSEIAGFDITPDAGTTLRKILNYKLDSKLDQFEIISVGANKELQLWNALQSMIHEWDNKIFPTGPYKETGVQILSNLDDIQALLDDHILKTLSMRGSAFMKPCETEVLAWYDKIKRVNETLDQWGKVQANFLYLLPIFSSKDIVAQMPEEGRLFLIVEQTFTRNMGMILRQPLVMETAPASGLLESLIKAVELLDDITNGVNNYLEKKRLYFPRFFFLSNDEMLEILSETKDPLRVLPHLSKCFEGINSLEFDEKKNVMSMISGDMEIVPFVDQVSTAAAGGSVEKWLLGVEYEMLKAVREQMGMSFEHYPKVERYEWVLHWPQMVALCVSQIYWAANVHINLRKSVTDYQAMNNFFAELTSDLHQIVSLVRSTEISNLNRITIKSLIVIDVHAKDVVEELIRLKINSEYDFQWMSQLRYYWEEGDSWVRIINATVPYANEYLGNSDRLVITPLTDRCYRTLVGAYQLHLNGAPEGPAGTGKTETTKDLAKALAVQCKVFNCSDGLDYKAMGKFFKGLASSGAWACFDEFNRIELEVLSVVAQQILLIVQAVRANAVKFVFENTELTLNPSCYVCITMNPGYAGRSELPDNLKVLFRSVAMMVPDYAMIGEISLYSYGFVDARKLAVKIVTTYRLCSEQLSMQNHYDYGMRAVKTVLSACGNIKKQFPNELEDILLLRSLIDVNLPKFMSFDIPLFEGIISDIFPGINLPTIDYSLIEAEFKKFCKEMVLEPTDSFLTKVIQTYEMMIVRHGFMLVGEPLAGKSKTLDILAKILSSLKIKDPEKSPYFQHVQMGIMNPKSITMNQLYGSFDPVSYEWTDGLVARIFRDFAMTPTPDRKWVIFDGPVDAVWIENMNTVLDDNKKLCLTSGEVITMTKEMSMIFEVMDLAQASPATVSRCGMIYMEPTTLGWQAFANTWLQKSDNRWADEESIPYIKALFNWLLDPCQEFVRKNCTQYLKPGEYNCLTTTFDIFEMCLNEAIDENPEDYQKYLPMYFQAAIIFSLIWGVAGILDSRSREKFDAFLRKHWADEENIPANVGKLEIAIPVEGLLVDYIYIFKQRGAWRSWPDIAKRMEVEETSLGVQVPTVDTARYMHLLKMHIDHKKKILLVGPTGTGKSVYVQNYLMNRLNSETNESAFMTFTVMITANQTQELLISKLQKWKRGIYGAPKGKNTVLFVDDMNMPIKEEYGAQPPLELLRQYFDYGHVYDLKDSTKIFIHNVIFVSACGLPGGSRQDVYPRFLNHFNIFSIDTFSDDTMNRIFVNVLLNGFRKTGHGNDVFVVVNQIVSATQQIYKMVQNEMRATPAKSHYIFNLRDISRVVTGCSLLRKESVNDKKVFVRLWYHEALRVFYDRLVDDGDRKWMFNKLNECVKANFKEKLETVFDNYCNEAADSGEALFTLDIASRVFFGVYFDEDSVADERRYEEVPTMAALYKLAMTSLDDYNSTRRSKMDITLFTFALQHLNRICRIISIGGASALLIGLGGSGRQSLTKLATNMVQTSFFQPEITKNYGANDWHDDLKSVLKEAGGLDKHTVFLMTENQIKMELFLQDIDCLLNQGEVPNIYAIDEKQEILEMVRLAAQGGNRNIDISPLQVFSFFVNRCKKKLHIVLCLSPIGDSLRTRVRLYPSLVNCCTIDWYQSWPEEALQMVAKISLENVNVPSEEVKQAIVETTQYFHTTASSVCSDFCQATGRYIYLTNASFLELIQSFQKVIGRKQQEVMDAKMRYIGGLDTLASAADAISIMQKELNDLQPKLLSMAENSRKMLLEINTESVAAQAAAEQVKKDEIVAGIQAEAAQELKSECEKDLAQAIPVLEEALQALNTLKPADITLVKSMKNPPSVIKLVMAAVCVIKGIPPDRIADPATGKMVNDYWGPSKRILGDLNFLQALKDFDKDNINPEIMKKIRKDFIPHKDFNPKIVAKASSAAKGLCQWIIAMDLYDNVAKIVAPKKAKLIAAEKEYADTMTFLNEKRELTAALEAKVAKLNEDLDKANQEMRRTQDEADLCESRLSRAKSLIDGLGGEKSRWTKAAEDLQSLYDHLPGDILISCGVIAYLSAVNYKYRSMCVEDWYQKCVNHKIPLSENYSITKALGLDITIQNWNINGLPNDVFSTENAIISANSSRYSLFIDPQGQANNWIKNTERKNRLSAVKFNQANYMKIIAESMEYGYPVIIENVLEELEVPLDPILLHKTFTQGGHQFISLGDNIVPLHKNFRLYMTCNLRNPHFLPETFNKVTIINFALTQSALEDQLLSIVVAKERPDLQELRMNLTDEAAKNKAALVDAENMILKTLTCSEGDILENEGAIQILGESKTLSIDIVAKQEASKETSTKIEAFRLNYKPVAIHSSILYYSITDLPNIDPMYQFSLNWYINLYMYSIETANKSKELPRRIKFLVDAVTRNLYNNVCRSIFDKDKLLFSFILCCRILLGNNQIEMRHMVHLLTSAKESGHVPKNPDPSWITETIWANVLRLEELPELKGLVKFFQSNLGAWKKIYDHAEPELQPLPEPWHNKTTRFEKIIILKSLRPDKVFLAIRHFIAAEMGSQFVTPPDFDISKSFMESTALTPLIFILSPGADPLGSLLSFAERTGYDETFQSISLGQGQGPIAQNLIKVAQELGYWVCLQNCHLAASWMPKLEFLWENMDTFNTSPGFRLWLTSYPTPQFPVALLQNGVKMTNEPPTGLKENIMRSYNSEPINDQSFYTGVPKQDRAFTRLLFGICFFHAVVQERRKYGPLGWNIAYGFNESDLQISVLQLRMLLNQYEHVPYDAISYLTAECNYGGRVTDTWDRRAIVTILADYVNSEVVSNNRYKFAIEDRFIVPRKTEHREILRYVDENYPSLAAPDVYGLHANSGITRDLQTTKTLLDSMILILGSEVTSGGGIGQSAEQLLLDTVKEIVAEMPQNMDIEAAKKKYPVEYSESMNTVITQEMERFLKLQLEIRASCRDVENAVHGIIVMTPELEAVITAIKLNRIPAKWMKKSYPSLKPLASYIQDLFKRINWLHHWHHHSKPPTFWISGFFFTQAFLTGAMQNFARKYKIPIDTLTFDHEVLNETYKDRAPEDGVYINGLFLEGARWNWEENILDEQLPKVLIYSMPAIYLKPTIISELQEGNRYKSPLYKTAERKGTLSTTGHSTNYVIPLLLNTKLKASHWVKRSVALICQTND
ncbi:dynein heavy chain 12, axonemal [Lucilia sericata]|uniref:dynein heavy chain 12, axonemal n=1 Tax=Lucilia sericata TaxID=13632 RepID=UPI0018A868A5|nr:dynein heavy chain 12, axonemal [Lucilia sericata]